jgi:hypothetical protein
MEGKDEDEDANDEENDKEGNAPAKTETKDDTNKSKQDAAVTVVVETAPEKTASGKGSEDDLSDAHSNDSDFPPTPAEIDLVEENIREAKEIRTLPGKDVSAETLMTALSQPQPKDVPEPVPEVRTSPEDPEDDEKFEVVRPDPTVDAKTMEGWEMLQMVLQWVRKEHSADEKALARQLANKEISYRFLWLYLTPGKLISFEDPISKQQMGARVSYPLQCR